MKKNFKGFTLIECLIALAILGIASLVMAQIYANISQMNRNNHNVNTSLSYQMKVVEDATGTDAIPIYYGSSTNTPDGHSVNASTGPKDGAPPNQTGTLSQKNFIEITKCKSDGTLSNEKYCFPVDIYVLLSRDGDGDSDGDGIYGDPSKINNAGTWVDNPAYDGPAEKDISLRYKYIVGHNN